MKLKSVSFLCLLAVVSGIVSAQDRRSATPGQTDTVQQAGTASPFFVSARAATDDQGQIRWSAFPTAARLALQTRLDERDRVRRSTEASGPAGADAEPCSTMVLSFPHVGGPTRSWEELVEHAEAAYRGVVVATTPGFEFAAPTTLLSVRIVRRIRGAQGFPTAGDVKILYPAADFAIGEMRFCNAGPNAPFVPVVGDEVLILAYDKPTDQSKTFLLTLPEQLIFGRDQRVIGSPDILRGRKSSSIEELVRAIEAARPLPN